MTSGLLSFDFSCYQENLRVDRGGDTNAIPPSLYPPPRGSDISRNREELHSRSQGLGSDPSSLLLVYHATHDTPL
jgi:hypothetical protein